MSGPAGGPFRRVLSASRVIHIDKNRIVSDVRFSEKKKNTRHVQSQKGHVRAYSSLLRQRYGDGRVEL